VAIIQKIKFHWSIIVVSIIIGAIYASPNLVFINSPEYRGIPINYTDHESYYLSRINAAYIGCFVSCNPFLSNENRFPFFDPSISPVVLAIPGIFFGLNVVKLKLIYEFLLPAILSLLIYTFIYRISPARILALTGSVIILLGYNLLNIVDIISWSDIWSSVTNKYGLYSSIFPLPYSRIVNPAFSSIYFWGTMHVILSYWRKQEIRWLLLLTILFGFSFYIYFYTYTFLFCFFLVLFLISLQRKNFVQSKGLLIIVLGGLIIGSGTIVEVYNLIHHPLYQNLPKIDVTESRVPEISILGISVLLSSILYLRYQKRHGKISDITVFIFALVISPILLKNQHIVFGTIVQHSHYDWYYITPIMIITLSYIFYSHFKNTGRYSPIFIGIIFFTIYNSVVIQTNLYELEYPYAVKSQREVAILTFLKTLPHGSTIIVPPSLDRYLHTYTHLRAPWSENSTLYLYDPTRRELWKNLYQSEEFMKRAIEKYNVSYIIVDRVKSVYTYDIIKYFPREIYRDDKYLVLM